MRSRISFCSTTRSGSGALGVVQGVQQRDAVAARVGRAPELVERADRRIGDLQQRGAELLDRQLELARELLLGRDALQPRLELEVGALDLAGAGAHRARHPVERAQLVEDRALDARDRVGLEADLAAEVEALDRGDQAAEAVGDQVGLVDVRRQARAHAPGDVLDQRRVGDDETVARLLVTRRLVAPPQIAKLDGFYVRLHRGSPNPLPEQATLAGDCGRRHVSAARTLPECKPASSRSSRARAAPGSRAGRRRRRADGSRRSDAARAGAPRRRGRPAPTRSAAAAERRRSRAGAPTWRAAARARRRARAPAAPRSR